MEDYFFIAPIVIGLFVLVFVFAVDTYKIKKRYLRWICILLPPSSLVLLVWIPKDWFASAIWLTAIVAMLFSVCSIVVKIVAACDEKVGVRQAASAPLAVRFIRPVMVVGLYFLASNIVDLSMESADIYAIQLGRRMQRACDANGICPESIKEWPYRYSDSDIGQHYYGKYGTKYPIRYEVSEDGKEFEIKVYHHMDEDFYVTGGVNKNLGAKIDGGGVVWIDVNELAPN